MQRAFEQLNESAPEPIRVRIGLNAGEPIAEDDDLFGTTVNPGREAGGVLLCQRPPAAQTPIPRLHVR